MVNWKTSVFGSIFAVGTTLSQLTPATIPAGVAKYSALAAAISGILAAFFTKDSNVTGGDKGNVTGNPVADGK